MKNFRALKSTEIEVSVDRINEYGVNLLLHKNARIDMALLDETVGPENWTRTHSNINGKLFCTVSIWDADKGQWISKSDVGVPSNFQAEKGESSDSFKRACTCWGIGRELYTAPDIFFPASDCNISEGKNGKKVCYDKFSVVQMVSTEELRQKKASLTKEDIDESVFLANRIEALCIQDDKTKKTFVWTSPEYKKYDSNKKKLLEAAQVVNSGEVIDLEAVSKAVKKQAENPIKKAGDVPVKAALEPIMPS